MHRFWLSKIKEVHNSKKINASCCVNWCCWAKAFVFRGQPEENISTKLQDQNWSGRLLLGGVKPAQGVHVTLGSLLTLKRTYYTFWGFLCPILCYTVYYFVHVKGLQSNRAQCQFLSLTTGPHVHWEMFGNVGKCSAQRFFFLEATWTYISTLYCHCMKNCSDFFN